MEQMTTEQSMVLIRQMIANAKEGYSEKGTLYLIWGYVVLAASLAHFALMTFTDYQHPHAAWLLIAVGIVASIVYGIRDNRERVVSTYVDNFMKYVWIAFGVMLFVVLAFMGRIGFENTYPVVLLVYGYGLFVSGGALTFRPLIIGGILCWILAVSAFFVTFQYQLLLLASAVLLGYIIPGHMLSLRSRRAGL